MLATRGWPGDTERQTDVADSGGDTMSSASQMKASGVGGSTHFCCA